jgi:hypothetical protein
MAKDKVPVGLFPGDYLGDSNRYEKEVKGYITSDMPYN